MNIENTDGFSVAVATDVDTATAQDWRSLTQTLAAGGMLCLRLGEKLDLEQFTHLAGHFGTIKEPVGRTKSGGEYRYSPTLQHINAGYVASAEEQRNNAHQYGGLDSQRPGLFETYHCDDTYTTPPARLTMLHARELPPSGGGPTRFIDMRAALASLGDDLRASLSGHTVHYAYNNEDAFAPRQAARGEAECLVDVEHPLIRDHPIAASQALYLDLDRATHIVDMALPAGRELLRQLQDHAERTAPSADHHWLHGDVLLWDNFSVQHKAVGNFALGEPRRFWRYMLL